MGLILKLKNALAEQSCLPNTVATYCFWSRKFYEFNGKPASIWTGDYGFVLRNPVALPFRPCKGALKFFSVS